MIARTIWVAGQDASRPSSLRDALLRHGSEILHAHTQAQLLGLVDHYSPDCGVVFCSPEIDGETIRMAEEVRRVDEHCPVLILTSTSSVHGVMDAFRAGVSDVLDRDTPAPKIIERLQALSSKIDHARSEPAVSLEIGGADGMVGHGAAMVRIRSQIGRIAATSANVLITGESGTGKELAAELIHRNSQRSSRSFVAINCAAVPDTLLESELFGHARGAYTGAGEARAGKLEHAAGGTLFLDEVGDMSLLAQAKILRALESRVIQRLGSNQDMPIEIRLVAATNQDLEALIREKKFRQDLYFRLNVLSLNLPPLRDRTEDIPELVEHLMQDISQRHSMPVRRIENQVIRRLESYDWPGNIRELRNVLESMMVLSSARSIGYSDVPEHIRQTQRSCASPIADERSKILRALTSAQWNRTRAAEILHCSRMTLYRKMVKFAVPSQPQ